MTPMSQLAQNLARNCSYAVFPCREDKRPSLKRWPELASTNPDTVAELWRHAPGPLIGIATGNPSGISVLDVDPKHDEGARWWRRNCRRLLPTRTYQTRSGGLHLYFRHIEGIRNSQGKICSGIDVRGQGGYVISWFAAGFACFDYSNPAPWPGWLLSELNAQRRTLAYQGNWRPGDDRHAGLVRQVAAAATGQRNAVLFWAACRLAEGRLHEHDIEVLLLPAAIEAGLSGVEACRTINSAITRASR